MQGLVPGRERGERPAVQSVHRAICHRGGRDGDGNEQVQAAERDCLGVHHDRDGAAEHASRGQRDAELDRVPDCCWNRVRYACTCLTASGWRCRCAC